MYALLDLVKTGCRRKPPKWKHVKPFGRLLVNHAFYPAGNYEVNFSNSHDRLLDRPLNIIIFLEKVIILLSVVNYTVMSLKRKHFVLFVSR